MASRLTAALVALVAAACTEEAPAPAPPVGLDLNRDAITVSGVSSGAYMAGQLHVARSATISGAALIAGGPYGCAGGDMRTALGPCVSGDGIDSDALAANARASANRGDIDALANLSDDRVWLFHGTLDEAVGHGATLAARDVYSAFIDAAHITLVDDVAAAHGMPTLDRGAECNTMAEPWLNACDYDAAGELLAALLGDLTDPAGRVGELVSVVQPGHADAGMLAEARAYIPSACAAGAETCRVHVALHGCRQSTEFVGEAFARDAGYNRWAETNRIVVLYPQAAASRIAPLNPLGCWDWWGYTGENYAARGAAQIEVIMATVDALAGAAR